MHSLLPPSRKSGTVQARPMVPRKVPGSSIVTTGYCMTLLAVSTPRGGAVLKHTMTHEVSGRYDEGLVPGDYHRIASPKRRVHGGNANLDKLIQRKLCCQAKSRNKTTQDDSGRPRTTQNDQSSKSRIPGICRNNTRGPLHSTPDMLYALLL
jgi:hypothetical protein